MSNLYLLVKYRIHVIFLFFLIMYASIQYESSSDQMLPVSLAFTCLIAFIYIINKATDIKEDSKNNKKDTINKKKYKATVFISLFLLILPLYYLFTTDKLLLLIYLIGAANGFLYSWKVFGFRFKSSYFGKTISAAFTWAFPFSMVPAALDRTCTIDTVIYFFFLYAIVAACEIYWDVRDRKGDLRSGVKTIPNQFGLKKTKIILSVLLLLAAILFSIALYSPYSIITLIMFWILILATKETWSEWYYHGIIFIWIAALLGILFF